MNKYIVLIEEERLDKYLSSVSDITRNNIKKLIKLGNVTVNQEIVIKPKYKIKNNDIIKITKLLNKEIKVLPENIELDIIYEDKDLIIINKPSGMVTHPAIGNYSNTLVNGLIYHFKNLSNINGNERPGIVHRLDKDTSGLLIVAKNNKTHTLLVNQLKKHEITREYIAIVEGNVKNKITHINLPIGRNIADRKKMAVKLYNSKTAITHIHLIKALKNISLIKCILETGRTHQIRVHLAYIKHPILGDNQYGNTRKNKFGQFLHAQKISFTHPIKNKKMTFKAKLPREFKEKIKEFKI